MKNIWIALIYIGFFGMIASSVYFLESGWPLMALIFFPHVKGDGDDNQTPLLPPTVKVV